MIAKVYFLLKLWKIYGKMNFIQENGQEKKIFLIIIFELVNYLNYFLTIETKQYHQRNFSHIFIQFNTTF